MKTLLERFLGYAAIDTRSDPKADEKIMPSSVGQTKFIQLLKDELKCAGIASDQIMPFADGSFMVRFDATSESRGVRRVCLAAHVDTAPDAPGGATTIVHNYTGGDIRLPRGNTVIPAKDMKPFVGHLIVTGSGDTTLGGDDKAGVAIMMELACNVRRHLPAHGPFDLWFCVDEEIGRVGGSGIKSVPKEIVESWWAMFNLDGGVADTVDVGCFCGWETIVTFLGNSAHPGVDADKLRPAHYAVAKLVTDLAATEYGMPWTSAGTQPFIYVDKLEGGPNKASIHCHPRSFDKGELPRMEKLIKELAKVAAKLFRVKYRCTGKKLMYVSTEPAIRAVDDVMKLLKTSFSACGMELKENMVRGGTDGAMLNMTYQDLASPNLGVGMHNIHGVQEFLPVAEMNKAFLAVIKIMERVS